MILTIKYTDESERQRIISDNNDKYLIEEKNIREGNFLVFSTIKPINLEVEELKQKVELQQIVTDDLIMNVIPSL